MSRPDGEGLLAAIAAAPDDDLPRLVYADWLDDYGDRMGAMRAKFIRLQIARAREGLTVRPTRKESILLNLFAREWHPEWPDAWHEAVEYDRGFPYHVALPCDQAAGAPYRPELLAEPGRELAEVRSLAVEDLTPTDSRGVAETVAPLLLTHFSLGGAATSSAKLWAAIPQSVADLSASGSHLNEDFLNTMVARRDWPNVRRLAVSAWQPYPDGGAAISGAAFPAVTDLTFNASDDPLHVVRSKLARPARRLTLTLPSPEVAADLLGSLFAGAVPDLSELSVLACNPVAPVLAPALAALPAGRLTLLAMIRFNDQFAFRFADALAEALMSSPGFATLRHLDLKEYAFSPGMTRALIEAAADAGVQRLAVRLAFVNADFSRFLAGSPALDAFARFEVPAHGHPPEHLAKLAARLGPRAATSCITADYFAATRRWRPL